jgi:hypothetical protein
MLSFLLSVVRFFVVSLMFIEEMPPSKLCKWRSQIKANCVGPYWTVMSFAHGRRCGAGFPVDDAAQFLIGTIKITNFDPTSRPVIASGNFAMFDLFTNQVCWDLASSWF